MTGQYSTAEYDAEHAAFERSPTWELRNVKRALSTFTWENTSAQWARLAAVTDILRQRKAKR